jgi:hypothetical protein
MVNLTIKTKDNQFISAGHNGTGYFASLGNGESVTNHDLGTFFKTLKSKAGDEGAVRTVKEIIKFQRLEIRSQFVMIRDFLKTNRSQLTGGRGKKAAAAKKKK